MTHMIDRKYWIQHASLSSVLFTYHRSEIGFALMQTRIKRTKCRHKPWSVDHVVPSV